MPIQPESYLPVIHTRRGFRIPATPGYLLNLDDASVKPQEILDDYPDRKKLRERRGPDGGYNCHGLTFLGRRAWLEDPAAVRRILEDDEYQQVGLDAIQPGDVAVYYDRHGDIEHTGFVVGHRRVEGQPVAVVLSKWRDLGEYLHWRGYYPYNWVGARFLREGHDSRFDERNRARLRF